ncbi:MULTISPECIES: prepilin-type N-terminal cleavage/methylation domain-containing protein [Exiguobacterium]|uniref:prepilin-type N-terminal cleavage/methylation domain-containing protein n=1 Tax=Exiguobacterium sp. MER 193 TaxID=2939564 RepID=UPI00203E5B87|nr:prepilin-type N-terminal cleavage/methylation domain-containing protein [Exiguobacterium sp. MER 193]MCM3280774.1 prepilin-type N-terminal cleavage/methylation domain-containing protein [Exiguobacterium sp. MER 193]
MVEKLKMIWQDAKQLKDERGLTLVELLVVVVILGIIAAIAVVAIGGIIENSKKDAMVADAKQMVSAAKLYTASNPVSADTTMKFAGSTGTVDGTQYVDNLKDPFTDSSGYTSAYVTIKPSTDGKYTYSVNVTGTKFKLEAANESAVKKANLSAITAP